MWLNDAILNDEPVNGARVLLRRVSPRRQVLLTKAGDLADATDAVSYACQCWGGASSLLIPTSDEGPVGPFAAVVRSVPDAISRRGINEDALSGSKSSVDGYTRLVEPLLSATLSELEAKKPPVKVALPARDDPWYVGYLGVLGTWPATPDPALLDIGNLVPELTFDELLTVSREAVAAPSAADLIDRISPAERTDWPVRASTWLLAPQPHAWRPETPGEWRPPGSSPQIRSFGPNVLVVYEPGSDLDLALLWSLRALHGLPFGLPLGVPKHVPLGEVVTTLSGRRAISAGLFGRLRVAVTSLSVSADELQRLAADVSMLDVVPPDALIAIPRRAARLSSEAAVFAEGVAVVSTLAPDDRQLIRSQPSRFSPSVTVAFQMTERPAPDIEAWRREFNSGMGPDGFEIDLRSFDQVDRVEWPTGWLTLEAAVRDRRLRARPSEPGLAAVAFVDRIGGVHQMEKLICRPLLDRIHALGERRGASWFRSTLRKITATHADSETQNLVQQIQNRVDDLYFGAFADDQHTAPFSAFRQDLGGDRRAADAWIRWADEHGVLVRGADVVCDRCGLKSWKAAAEFAGVVVCHGCGRAIPRALPTENLTFTYRASEPTLRLVEADALPHLIALRWWAQMYSPFPNRVPELFGLHPGIELSEPSGSWEAEVDVILLFTDGSLVPGEVKRSGQGLKEPDIAKLDAVAERLDSPWSFVATLGWSKECDDIWNTSVVQSGRPRIVLTGDDLLQPRVIGGLGTDLFAWREDDDAAHAKLASDFAAGLKGEADWQAAMRIPGRMGWDDE